MSECQKLYTERELVLAQREAFIDGYITENDCTCDWTSGCSCCRNVGTARAAARYPLPKVTRPRVVKDEHGGEWCFRAWPKDSALLMYRKSGCIGWSNEIPMVSLELAPVLADLFANPTEECEVDE